MCTIDEVVESESDRIHRRCRFDQYIYTLGEIPAILSRRLISTAPDSDRRCLGPQMGPQTGLVGSDKFKFGPLRWDSVEQSLGAFTHTF